MKTWMSLILILLFSAATAHAQIPPSGNPRDALDPEFVGMETTFVYREGSAIKTTQHITKLSRFKRGTRCFQLFSTNSAPLSSIPTAGLAAEHWWLSFEMLMICQRDYAGCLESVTTLQSLLGECLVTDPTCSPYAALTQVIRDYWVPFNITHDFGVPTRQDFLAHLDAGMSGINTTLSNLIACKQTQLEKYQALQARLRR